MKIKEGSFTEDFIIVGAVMVAVALLYVTFIKKSEEPL
jgi:hypothetical protein